MKYKHHRPLSDWWLYLGVVLAVGVVILAIMHSYNETPKRLLVDVEEQVLVDKYLKQCKPNQFVGIEECKIIFIVTEKGE